MIFTWLTKEDFSRDINNCLIIHLVNLTGRWKIRQLYGKWLNQRHEENRIFKSYWICGWTMCEYIWQVGKRPRNICNVDLLKVYMSISKWNVCVTKQCTWPEWLKSNQTTVSSPDNNQL